MRRAACGRNGSRGPVRRIGAGSAAGKSADVLLRTSRACPRTRRPEAATGTATAFPRTLLALALAVVVLWGCGDDAVSAGGADAVDVGGIGGADAGGGGDVGAPDAGSPDAGSLGGDIFGPEDAGPDGPAPGEPGYGCTSANECNSGWCVQGPDGLECAASCVEDDSCPEGWVCSQVATHPDLTFVCVFTMPNLCKPCGTDADCAPLYGEEPGVCVSAGEQDGSYCSYPCKANPSCPTGYTCGAPGETERCWPESGECACTTAWEGLSTPCAASNDAGTCAGERTCAAGAYTECSAATATAEACNGADDDCDGEVDEGLGGAACDLTNEHGTCPGTTACAGGDVGCTGTAAAAEDCDGADQDCDGEVDEGFPDLDADGTADCMDDDLDGDGVANEADNCPLDANAEQADLDLDGKGDPCDPDADGDLTANDADCAPLDAKVYPGATEECNGTDDDCDGETDEGFPDLDADGIADCVDDDKDGDGVLDEADNCPLTPNEDQADQDGDGKGDACENDTDGDGDPDLTDCAPLDEAIHHAAKELCDGADQNCNAIVDEGYPDTDKDGVADCVDPDDDGDGTGDADDCAPLDPLAYVGAPELCNGKDDDCDDQTDEGYPDTDTDGQADCVDTDDDGDGVPDTADNCPLTPNPGQEDLDKDGKGDVCDGDIDGDKDPNDTDCAPLDPKVHHEAAESCNGADDDCDGLVDEGYSDLDSDGVADCMDDDDDGDGVLDGVDNCPVTANADQADQDADGKGDACENDTDGDGDPDLTDCAPSDPLVSHGAQELCDGADQNCNAIADEGYPDTDKDGQADCVDADDDGDTIPDEADNCPLAANKTQKDTDSDGQGDACDTDDDDDGEPDESDCGPLDPAVFPGALETCNGKDDDCDGQTDEADASGCTTFFYNKDGDGFGIDLLTKCLCAPEAPFTALVAGDCNDQNAQVFPDATEVCNGKDDDCDEAVDEDNALGCTTHWQDGDLDTWGGATSACLCVAKPGWAAKGGDCDDAKPLVNPAAIETCNGVDDDCDGQVDEAGANGCDKLYADKDADGFGPTTDSKCLCGPSGVWTALADGDCNDADGGIYPGALEVCDDKDNNCNGQLDEGVKTTFYIDNDKDGYGASFNSKDACTAPAGYVGSGGDCNDFNDAISPGAAETCNGIDDNCNGQADEGLPLVTVWVDIDGDAFGAKGTTGKKVCLIDQDGDGVGESAPAGWALVADDCDDSQATVYPGAPELCDGKLNDCKAPVQDFQCPTSCGGSWPYSAGVTSGYVSVAQMDSGNTLEIVVQGAGNVTVLNHDGTVKWTKAASVQYSHPLLADMNLDGTMDVVLVENGLMRVMDGATGAVLETHSTPGGSGWRPGMAFDLDNDGVTDIVGIAATPAGGMPVVLRNGTGGAKQILTLKAPAGAYLDAGVPALADLNGDGIAEILVGTGYSTCNSPTAPACNGMLLAFNGATGALAANPLTQFVVPDPPNTYTGGPSPLIADLDADGEPEVFQWFSSKFGGGYPMVWDLDGTAVTSATALANSSPVLAPIDAAGKLVADGTLLDVGGAAVDLDGDGAYEVVKAVSNGWGVYKAGKAMDGYPVTVKINAPLVADVNRDGRLDVIGIGADSTAVYCSTLGEGTWDFKRVLTNGASDTMAASAYRTGNLDPYEPNDIPGVTFDPAAVTDPVKDTRAFPLRGFLDKYSSSSGWSRSIVAKIGHKGDRDFYWATGTYINASVDLGPGAGDYDLYIHMYKKVGATWQYITTRSATSAGGDTVDCHWSEPCPDAANSGTKTFLLEVRPKDIDKDWGPWPYRLRINYGAQ